MGFKYGTLIEDFFTGFRLQCEGWRSIFCNPKRAAFLGDAPINLVDALNQLQRWSIGFLQLSEPCFVLYLFLVLGAYGQDLLEFLIGEGTVQKWWNNQRMWMIRGLSAFLYGSLEFFLKFLGISTYGFGLTSKVIDDEQSKRYGQGMFEFGASSNMFVPLITAAIINLVSFLMGLVQVLRGSKMEGLFLQMFLAGFVVLNALPIYEAMVLRNDQGRIPFKTTATSTCLALALYGLVSLPLGNRN